MQGLASLIRSTGVPYTLENLSYDPSGRGLFTGAGGLGGTTRLRPEAVEAALTVAPMVGSAARVAGRGAMTVGRAGERYAERVVPQIMERGGLPAEMVAAMGQGTQSPLTVYHGSPHRFTNFDASKIGTGEGNQAYGHGLYFAEKKGIAKSYAKNLGGGSDNIFKPQEGNIVDQNIYGSIEPALNAATGKLKKQDLVDAIKDRYEYGEVDNSIPLKTYLDRVENLLKTGQMNLNPKGTLYTIDLPDEQIARMLDWDKPLGQQSSSVLEAINKTRSMLPTNAMDDLGGDLSLLYGKDVTPNQFLNTWESITGKTGSGEQALRQLGIPGIRYLDATSRDVGKGTSNFVVFPGGEDLLKIVDTNPPLRNPIMYEDPFGSSVR
jgi:hypothetical protein